MEDLQHRYVTDHLEIEIENLMMHQQTSFKVSLSQLLLQKVWNDRSERIFPRFLYSTWAHKIW